MGHPGYKVLFLKFILYIKFIFIFIIVCNNFMSTYIICNKTSFHLCLYIYIYNYIRIYNYIYVSLYIFFSNFKKY